MQAIDFQTTFLQIQKNHAASMVKAALTDSKNLGELGALLAHKEIGPLVRDLRVKDVMDAKSYDRLYTRSVRQVPIEVSPLTRKAVKRALLRLLANGDANTPALESNLKNAFPDLPRKFTYAMLRELEIAQQIRRVSGKCPIFWSLGVG